METTITQGSAASIELPMGGTAEAAPFSERSRPVGAKAVVGAIIAAGVAAGHLPLLLKYFVDLGSREQYEFYPLVLVAAAWLAYARLSDVPVEALRRGSAWVAGPALAASLGLLVLGALFYMRWFAAPAAWLTLAAAVWRVGGPAVARAMLPAGVLLLVIIPPPFHYDDVLTRSLQGVAVRQSSALLDLLGVPHFMSGNVLEIPGHRLMVEEACSGINSLLSVVAFTLLFAFLRRRPARVTAALLVMAVWFVLCANVVRITLGAYARARHGIDLMDESVHGATGLVLFGCCVGLVMSADALISALTQKRKRISPDSSDERNTSGKSAERSAGATRAAQREARNAAGDGRGVSWIWWVFAAAFAITGVATHGRVKDCWPTSRMPANLTLTPPADVGPWKRVTDAQVSERTENFAKYCQRWQYRRSDGLMAEVALAYPFLYGQHDPAACYALAGWSVTSALNHDDPRGASPFSERTLAKPTGMNGFDLFAAFDESGRWQAQPDRSSRPTGSIAYRFWLSRNVSLQTPTHEVQTLIVSRGPIGDADRRDATTLFLAAREALMSQALSQLPK